MQNLCGRECFARLGGHVKRKRRAPGRAYGAGAFKVKSIIFNGDEAPEELGPIAGGKLHS